MADTHETIADIRKDAEAKFRELVKAYMQRRAAFQTTVGAMQAFNTVFDRLEAAWKRERVLAVSIMRSKLYGIAGGLRAITARSDARQRGIHYTEVQNIAAQIENIADNGGEA